MRRRRRCIPRGWVAVRGPWVWVARAKARARALRMTPALAGMARAARGSPAPERAKARVAQTLSVLTNVLLTGGARRRAVRPAQRLIRAL